MDNNEHDDGDLSSSGSSQEKQLSGRSKVCKESKLQCLGELNQITNDEKTSMVNSLLEYASLSIQNKEMQNIANLYRQEISDYSKIFGVKKEDASNLF
jgi:hypothetical protein